MWTVFSGRVGPFVMAMTVGMERRLLGCMYHWCWNWRQGQRFFFCAREFRYYRFVGDSLSRNNDARSSYLYDNDHREMNKLVMFCKPML